MDPNLIIELELFLLVVCSFILPLGILGAMFIKRAISRLTVSLFSLALLLVSGVDVVLLQHLPSIAANTTTDRLIGSELTVALYLLPALFAGIGINVLSHVLVRHLKEAEDAFDRESHHRSAPSGTLRTHP